MAEGDSPVINFSSEATDSVEFIGINRGWNDNDPPINSEWQSSWCQGICFSKISQEDADLCAARMQMACSIDPGNGGGPGRGGDDGGDSGNGPWVPPLPPNFPPGGEPPHYDLFENTPQSSSYSCPDGTTFLFTTPAGTFVAMTQTKADSMAKSYADSKVKEAAICLLAIESKACLGIVYGSQINLEGAFPPFSFALVAGALPPGLKLTQLTARTGLISGTPTAGGNYTFTIRVVDSHGSFMQKTYTISVLAISNPTALPDAVLGAAYSEQLNPVGGFGPWVFSVMTGALPDGLTLSSSGLISGTPTLNGPFDFRVQVQDATSNACQFDFSIDATGGCPDFVTSIAIPGASPTCFVCSADGSGIIPRVLFVGGNSDILVYDRDTNLLVASITPSIAARSNEMVFAQAEGKVYISMTGVLLSYILVIDVNTLAEVAVINVGAANIYRRPTYDPINHLIYYLWDNDSGLETDLVVVDPVVDLIVNTVTLLSYDPSGFPFQTSGQCFGLTYNASSNEIYVSRDFFNSTLVVHTLDYQALSAGAYAVQATILTGNNFIDSMACSPADNVVSAHATDIFTSVPTLYFIDGVSRGIVDTAATAVTTITPYNIYSASSNLIGMVGAAGAVVGVEFIDTNSRSIACTRTFAVGSASGITVDPSNRFYAGTAGGKTVRIYA